MSSPHSHQNPSRCSARNEQHGYGDESELSAAELVAQMARASASMREIIAATGYSYGGVRYILKRCGLVAGGACQDRGVKRDARRKNITAARVRGLLTYDQDTGEFKWLGGKRAGTNACRPSRDGYLVISIDGDTWGAHRLAWLYVCGVWQTGDIDHINGIKTDNRIANLRDVPRHINTHNARRVHPKNKLGIAGVSLSRNKYRAFIRVNYKLRHLGVFDTPEEAQAAYLEAKRAVLPDFSLAAADAEAR